VASRFCSFCAAIVLVWFLSATRVLAAPILVGVDVQFGTLLRIDTSSGRGTPIGHVSDTAAGLAFDFNHGILYASSTTSKNLVRIDPATGATTVVGPMDVSLMHGLEYDPLNETLYGSTTSSANLYRISVETGEATLIGHHGISGLGGLAFDPVNGIMYGGDITGKSLYTVNLSTGDRDTDWRFWNGSPRRSGPCLRPRVRSVCQRQQWWRGLDVQRPLSDQHQHWSGDFDREYWRAECNQPGVYPRAVISCRSTRGRVTNRSDAKRPQAGLLPQIQKRAAVIARPRSTTPQPPEPRALRSDPCPGDYLNTSRTRFRSDAATVRVEQFAASAKQKQSQRQSCNPIQHRGPSFDRVRAGTIVPPSPKQTRATA
jgi:hypothetical protein